MNTNTDIETKLKEFHKYLLGMAKMCNYAENSANRRGDRVDADHYYVAGNAYLGAAEAFSQKFLKSNSTVVCGEECTCQD
jgi:hypothetical protein